MNLIIFILNSLMCNKSLIMILEFLGFHSLNQTVANSLLGRGLKFLVSRHVKLNLLPCKIGIVFLKIIFILSLKFLEFHFS